MMRSDHSVKNYSVPLVVKLGGSLQNGVSDLVPLLRRSRRPLLIVPGGGIFADTVRQARVADDSAHWMAIAAMDQYGWFIASHDLKTTDVLKVPEKTTIFLPYISMRQRDPLPHTWDITSDSISAWVADQLGLELLLLKSVDGITREGELQKQITTPIQNDVVDPFFIPFVMKNQIKTTIINGKSGELVEKFLNGELFTGTRIGTTF
jgi:5-(aminomethyl)-3-furanmethanol phosphate kinase